MIFILCYTGNNHAENYSIRNIAIYYKLLFLLDESGPGENIDHKSHEALLVCCCKRSNTTASFSLCHWQMISRRKIRKQTRIETNESRKHSTFARLILKPRCLYYCLKFHRKSKKKTVYQAFNHITKQENKVQVSSSQGIIPLIIEERDTIYISHLACCLSANCLLEATMINHKFICGLYLIPVFINNGKQPYKWKREQLGHKKEDIFLIALISQWYKAHSFVLEMKNKCTIFSS